MQGHALTKDQLDWYRGFTLHLKRLTDASANAAYAKIAATKGVKRESVEKCKEAEVTLAAWVVSNPYPAERRRKRQ